MEEYVRYWNGREEVRNIWVSLYSPQRGEESAECLSAAQREYIARELPRLDAIYPKLLAPEGYGQALLHPPLSPQQCTFSRMSKNYSADLRTRVEPCVFGGDPDCSQCGCSVSAAAHWLSEYKLVGPLKGKHLLHPSMLIGRTIASLQDISPPSWLEREKALPRRDSGLVQISTD